MEMYMIYIIWTWCIHMIYIRHVFLYIHMMYIHMIYIIWYTSISLCPHMTNIHLNQFKPISVQIMGLSVMGLYNFKSWAYISLNHGPILNQFKPISVWIISLNHWPIREEFLVYVYIHMYIMYVCIYAHKYVYI